MRGYFRFLVLPQWLFITGYTDFIWDYQILLSTLIGIQIIEIKVPLLAPAWTQNMLKIPANKATASLTTLTYYINNAIWQLELK